MKASILKLLQERYLLSTESSWDDIAVRVGGIYPAITEQIRAMKFIPSTPTLMNANTNGLRKGTLSSCFPMGITDSIDGIYDALKEAALVTKNAGGIGYNFSNLRGSNEVISTLDGRMSSGPMPFIDNFNSMLDGIRQGGARKGAGMAMLDVDHPNILEFIEAKKDWKTQRFNRFNFSIRIPDWFYDKLEHEPNSPMMVKNIKDANASELVDAEGKVVTIRELWNKILFYAHKSAEPGIFNSDIAFTQCSVTNYSTDVLANPCQEFTNIAYSSCNLGSINLTKYVSVNNGDPKFDFEELGKDIVIYTNFLNAVIDVNTFPVEAIKRVTTAIRPIGLGVMGLAHALSMLQIPYNSHEAHVFAKKLLKFITLSGMKTSVEIAKKDGAYPAFDYDTFVSANTRFWDTTDVDISEYLDIQKLKSDIKTHGIRNSCITSIAPTGTISFIADVSGGIEPIFALAFTRRIEKDKDINNNIIYEDVYVVDTIFDQFLSSKFNDDQKNEILKYVSDNNGSCRGAPHMSDADQAYFLTAQDLTSIEHLGILSAVAKYTSLSVSKTINLPESATIKDVEDVYIKAHKEGIIGITVYRDNCRGGVLLTNKTTVSIPKNNAPKRPAETVAEMHHLVVDKQAYYVAVGLYGSDPYEVFIGVNHNDDGDIYIPKTVTNGVIRKLKRGHYEFAHNNTSTTYKLTDYHTDPSAMALTRLLSTALRHGTDMEIVVTQLEKTKGSMNCFAKAIARTLKKYIKDGTAVHGEVCPNCGDSNLVRIEGCKTCHSCGHSLCS